MLKPRISITQRKDSKNWAGDQRDRYDDFIISCDDKDYKVVSDHFDYITRKDRISDNWLLNEIQTQYRKTNLHEAFILLLDYFKVHFPEINIQIFDWNAKTNLEVIT